MSEPSEGPDSTVVRVVLWRALHVEIDPPPHVLEDEIGLRLAAPDDGWHDRPDMDPVGTSRFRASIVARARFIEDLVTERADRDIAQYVILGAGLDTFGQRRPLALADEAGFRHARHVSASDLNQRYFAARTDGLRTSRGEELLVATT